MIIELLFSPIFSLIEIIINLLPNNIVIPNFISDTLELLKIPLSIFPIDLWIVIITNVVLWYSAQLIWSIIEWVYKKIPGVN